MKFTTATNNDLKLTEVQFNKAFDDVSEVCKNKFGEEFCHVELQGSYFCEIYKQNVLCFTVFTEKVIKFEGLEDSFTESNTQSVEALINDKKQILKKQVEFLNSAIYR
jgi:hypothetical protein